MENDFRRHEGDDQVDLWPETRSTSRSLGLFELLLLGLMFAALILLGITQLAGAEELPEGEGYWGVGHGRYHQLYSKMHNQHGTHCCNDGDCSPTQARMRPDGIWQAKQNGHWVTIAPDRHVVDAYGLGEEAHICFGRHTKVIYCFIPPNSGF